MNRSERFEFKAHPHRRYNPLTGEWILVSPHRSQRPWQGAREASAAVISKDYDPQCYLCPGNTRAGGVKNPDYSGVFVFENDFAALKLDTPDGQFMDTDLFCAKSEKGVCKVVCFSPRHDLTIPHMTIETITKVIQVWCREYRSIGELDDINYVQIFENKGSIMGCSNPHPHGQIWAQSTIPDEPAKEMQTQQKYLKGNGRLLLADYLEKELVFDKRVVVKNEHFVALVPFWATWPFETLILSRRKIQNILQFTTEEQTAFAKIYKILTTIYDNLFETSFPYSAGIHQAPTDGRDHPEWQFHMHFYPPLLRSASVKKFMVGYELLAGPQRDLTPEQSAKLLKKLPQTLL